MMDDVTRINLLFNLVEKAELARRAHSPDSTLRFEWEHGELSKVGQVLDQILTESPNSGTKGE